MSLLERIKVLRETNGNISINKLEKEAGLTRGSMSKWDAHAPSYEKIKKVADYFNVPVSYLTGEEQQKSPPPDGDGLWNVIQSNPTRMKLVEWIASLDDATLRRVDQTLSAAFEL